MSDLKIHRLQITNFRNLHNDLVEFSEGINCIFGNNGNGKTNLLEAIYVLVNKKSFRKNTAFPQYLSVDGDKPEILIQSVFKNSRNEMLSVSAKLKNETSNWEVNSKQTKKRVEAQTVFINPFDSYNFHNSASFRRNWFDQYISMLNPVYKKTYAKYTQALRMRNNLLTMKPKSFREQIFALDEQISAQIELITRERLALLSEIQHYCAQTFQSIFSEAHLLEIKLQTEFSQANQGKIREILQKNLPKDEISGHTSLGPHRDDYLAIFDGMNAYEYCSLGQQKMTYLSLIFAYIELFRYKFKAYPILLIDDVSGELDVVRWSNLVDYLRAKDFQVLITTANENFKLELEKLSKAKKLYVEAGHIFNME